VPVDHKLVEPLSTTVVRVTVVLRPHRPSLGHETSPDLTLRPGSYPGPLTPLGPTGGLMGAVPPLTLLRELVGCAFGAGGGRQHSGFTERAAGIS
jgi:hypothetical protein